MMMGSIKQNVADLSGNLHTLKLNNNKFSKIPDVLCDLENLTHLHLGAIVLGVTIHKVRVKSTLFP